MAQPKQTYRDVRVGSMNSLQLSNAQSSGNEPRISLMETIPLATTIDSDDTGPDVSPTSTSTTIAFPLFAKLATEIQDLIWEHASHTTRVVKIEASTLNTYHSHSLAFRTDFTPTGLLTACRGSRAAIKKMPRISVTLIKQQNLNSFGYTNFYPGKTIQINPDLDIILLWNSLKSPSIGNVLTPWLSAIANKSQSTQHPHPAAQGFSGKLYVIPTHSIDNTQDDSSIRDVHPILSGRDMTLQYKFDDTASRLTALKLTAAEAERFETMLKKRLVRWKEEKPTWNVPEGTVAVVKEA